MSKEKQFYDELISLEMRDGIYAEQPISIGAIIGAKEPINLIDNSGNLYRTGTNSCLTYNMGGSKTVFIENGSVEDVVDDSDEPDEISISFDLFDQNGKYQNGKLSINQKLSEVGLYLSAVAISNCRPTHNGSLLYPTDFDDVMTQVL